MRNPVGARGLVDTGETVASFPAYEAAQKAVSTLIAAEVPAREIAIVGIGLRSVERVTGRLGYAVAARTGALNGLVLGVLFAAIFVLGVPSVPIQAFVGVLFLGMAFGMLLSIVSYSFVRRRRDYSSVMQVVADRYEVTVAPPSLERARATLRPAPAAPSAPIADADTSSAEPPRYGERLPPPDAADGDDPPRDDAGS